MFFVTDSDFCVVDPALETVELKQNFKMFGSQILVRKKSQIPTSLEKFESTDLQQYNYELNKMQAFFFLKKFMVLLLSDLSTWNSNIAA